MDHLRRRSLRMLFMENLDIEIEFIINKQLEHLDSDETMIDVFVMPPIEDTSARFVGSYGVDGDIYGYYDLSFNDSGELVHSRLGMDVDEATEKVKSVYHFMPRSWR